MSEEGFSLWLSDTEDARDSDLELVSLFIVYSFLFRFGDSDIFSDRK